MVEPNTERFLCSSTTFGICQAVLYRISYCRILALDTWLHHGRMPENNYARGADEPKESAQRGGVQEQGDSNDEKSRVEMFLRDGVITKLQRLSHKLVDRGEATDEEDQGDQQRRIRDEGVHRQTCDDNTIVPRKVSSVI